jgi:hypothetical protein
MLAAVQHPSAITHPFGEQPPNWMRRENVEQKLSALSDVPRRKEVAEGLEGLFNRLCRTIVFRIESVVPHLPRMRVSASRHSCFSLETL